MTTSSIGTSARGGSRGTGDAGRGIKVAEGRLVDVSGADRMVAEGRLVDVKVVDAMGVDVMGVDVKVVDVMGRGSGPVLYPSCAPAVLTL